MNDKFLNRVSKRCAAYPSLNIGTQPEEVNNSNNFSSEVNSASGSGYWLNGTWYSSLTGDSVPITVTGTVPHNTVPSFPSPPATNWLPAKTAAEDFLKIQYAAVEVRCAITRKMIPVGTP